MLSEEVYKYGLLKQGVCGEAQRNSLRQKLSIRSTNCLVLGGCTIPVSSWANTANGPGVTFND